MSARSAAALGAVLALGVGLRLGAVDRPLDHRLRTAWRQSDTVQIARNFYREGMNLLYPRIDWRGDGPGYVESELPVLPWAGALLYHLLGYHEAVLRLLSALCAVAHLLLFAWLARMLLAPAGALVATAAVAVNPLLVYFATAIEPEALATLLALVAVVLLVRGRLVAAGAVVAAAILVKPQAVYLLALLAWRAARGPRRAGVVAALIAVVPPLLWYAWAHHLWATYGNSLGLSNEAHAIGLDMVLPPKFLEENLLWESAAVVTPLGWLLIAAGLRERGEARTLGGWWYLAAWAVYVVAARTAGDPYGGFAYHAASVDPAAVLLGAGFAALWAGRGVPPRWTWLARRRRRIAGMLAGGTLAILLGATAVLVHMRDHRPDLAEMHGCAVELAHFVPPDGRIVVNGGREVDDEGYPIAPHASMLFSWMDRKGFIYPTEELSLPLLEGIARRGGRYWVASHEELAAHHLQEAAARRFRAIADCPGGYTLFDLGGAAPGGTS
ncbi:MAG TPA: glycosyltransferase family 39 protein [Candidatus Binatia bacterium]|nr:glycosyltransferase family 39 protein [Candidatus Binatia bacterium]